MNWYQNIQTGEITNKPNKHTEPLKLGFNFSKRLLNAQQKKFNSKVKK